MAARSKSLWAINHPNGPRKEGSFMRSVLFVTMALLAGTARAENSGASFRAFLPSFEEGISRFINGDATLWKQNASRAADSTIMGAWGAYEKGWDQVGARYDWAASRFQRGGSTVKTEYLASGVSGDLAYTVAIERSEIRLTGQERPASMMLRVTHLFRRENDVWKLIHRHADPLMEKTAPADVLKK
jgi:ketosteroid isomerase-like protein